MKTTSSIVLILFVLLTIPRISFSQLSEGGTPPSFGSSLRQVIQTETMPTIDVVALLAEDEAEQKIGLPFRFGAPFEVSYDLQNSGTWETLPDGSKLWRLKIVAKEAYTINLIFKQFWLPVGAKFFIYNEDRSMVIGAFTNRNNKSHGEFGTSPVKGDVSILEYHQPANVSKPGVIEISRVIHGYKNIFSYKVFNDAQGFGSSGSCNNNVNCSVGDDWESEKRSAAMILTSGGSRICSGAMVNNVREDLTPFFLTAHHCLGGQNTWIFMFNYESPTCANINGPTYMTLSGSTLRANASFSDFALLEISESPPDSFQVFYSGWSAVDTAADSNVAIHHPRGDIKKISFNDDKLTSTSYLQTSSGNNSHWRIGNWEDGTTEPGSSGSPIYDYNHRILGQLHGGYASCASITSDWYGKFSVSWANGNSASTRLKDWLDPDNTGALELNGINFSGGCSDSDSDGVCNSEDICQGFDDNIDTDGDSVPDGCDLCEGFDDLQDTDGDSVPDSCDSCPGFDDNIDSDGDFIADGCDNCPATSNPLQVDTDNDGIGDLCDDCTCETAGDYDGSGDVDIVDLTFTVMWMFNGGFPTICLNDADVDANCAVDVADLTYRVNFMFKGGPALICGCVE